MRSKRLVIWLAFLGAMAGGTAVNFLAKGIPEVFDDSARLERTIYALTLNGSRLLFAAGVLAVLAWTLRLRVLPTWRHAWRYTVVGLLTIGISQALIFVALRLLDANPSDVAFIEAGILGVVIIYLLAGKRTNRRSIATAAVSLAGLIIFLDKEPSGSLGSIALVVSALLTGLGMIIDDRMKWPKESRTVGWRAEIAPTLRKTLFASFTSGIGTLGLAIGLRVATGAKGVTVPPVAWPWIAALAVFGTCLTWFSIFRLISLGQLILAAAVIGAVPIVTVVIQYIQGEPLKGGYQWVGGTIALVGLAGLMYLQMIRKPPSTEDDGNKAVVAASVKRGAGYV